MVFLLSLLTAILFVLLFEKPLQKNPIPFYVIFSILSLATIISQLQGMNPGGFTGKYLYPMFTKAGLGTSFFVLVMYAATFKNGSKPIKLLMPIRGQLSIIASILALGHVFSYSALLSPNVSALYIFSAIMLCIMIPLFITSFIKIRKKMNPRAWKNLQRFAYIFYLLIYVHILLLYVRGALRGDSRSSINILVYSIVFLWYFICRPLKAYSVKHKDFNLDKYRYISLILVVLVSIGFYLYVTNASVSADVSDDNNTSLESTESESDSASSVTDGVYSATCFGYAGDITVEIKVENGEVTDITLPNYEDEDDYKHFSEELIETLKQAPLADADTVSGATFSTRAVIDAYNEALKQAGLK
jgi:DMSO/TMAO reductase YedYZ heme-binding membrane subunit